MFKFKSLICIFAILSCFYLTSSFFAEENSKSQSPPLIPRQLLFGNPEKTSAKLSHDGKKLAYLAPNHNNVLNVWIRDLQYPGKDQQITSDEKQGIRLFWWQPDGSSILFLQDKDGDENTHLYQTRLSSLMTKDLTPIEGVKARVVNMDPRFPNEILIELNQTDPSLFDVYQLNLTTGELKLDTKNPGGALQWISDHNQKVRAYQSLTEDGSILIRIRKEVTEPWEDFLKMIPMESVEVQGFSADNQSLYVLTSADSNTSRLIQMDIKTGKQTLIVQDPDYDLSEVILHPTTHHLEAVGLDREKYEWIVLDPELLVDFNELSRRLKGSFSLTSRDLANENWVVVSYSDQRPSHFYLYHRQSKSLDFLFSTQPKLEQYQLSEMKPIHFKARDGLVLHGYLTLPVGLEPRNLPAVLLVHGGPWARDTWGLQPTVQWLANRGYAVLQINYRGSTGYGKSFLNAANREWAGKMHDDLIDGRDWLIAQAVANPDKIAIAGGSYGGYATLVGLTFTPDIFCCGVDIVGPSNLITLLQSFPPYWKPMMVLMNQRLGNLDTEVEFLKSRSPLFKVDQIKKPLLIGHGANDPRVKQAESDQIVQAMRQRNLPVEYLLFADEGHGFARPMNRLKFYAAMEEFLTRYLGGRSEPASLEENWDALKN